MTQKALQTINTSITMKKVSIITVNYDQPKATEALLYSLQRTCTYNEIEIIVVDNGSSKDPVPVWEKKFPNVIFIRSERNLGFAGGNNMAIKCTTGHYLFFVNNDTEFTNDLVPSMVAFMDSHPTVGAASPRICYYNKPEILQYAGFTPMNYYTCRNNCIGKHQQDTGHWNDLTGPTGFVHGAAMMIRKDVIRKVGVMPESYFLYYEEMDWCENIRKHGYDIAVNAAALIYHKESMSVGESSELKEYFMNRSRILFIRRNAPKLKQFIFYCYFLGIVAPKNVISYLRKKKVRFIKPLFKAIWWNITNPKDSKDPGYLIN
jgi:GT2 family glycosyltransferase